MLGKHPRAALEFSGGKDSTALLHLARPHLDKITVFFGDTGGVYPHVKDFVMRTCRELGAELVTVQPHMHVLDYHKEKGLPVDVLPLDACSDFSGFKGEARPGTRLQAWTSCCSAMIWQPMEQVIRQRGHTLVLRGSKLCDPHVTAPPGTVHDGVEYQSPLWYWSHADVIAFLADKEMAPQYPEILDSMDCWCCTGLMTGQYAKAKLEYARAHYPELWPVMVDRLKEVQRSIAEHTATVNKAIDGAIYG